MGPRSAEIKKEIESKFGFFPPFFEPAMNDARVLRNLWDQTLFSYVENPIPDVFKEKLAALLARYCTVPYCLLCHTSALRPLGISAAEVFNLLEMPLLGFEELAEKTKCLQTEPVERWPETGSHLEECILYCCIAIFLNQDTEKCHENLRRLLQDFYYNNLIIFLAYNRTALSWAEAHPELSYENDKRVIEYLAPTIKEEPKLAAFFDNYQGKVNEQGDRRSYWLAQEAKKLLDSERRIRLEAEELSKKLSIEKNKLDSVIANAPAGFALFKGPTHVFETVNSEWELLVSKRKYVGLTYLEAYPELVSTHLPAMLDKVFETGETYVAKELKIQVKGDSDNLEDRYYDFSYIRILDDGGKPYGVFCHAVDVTGEVLTRIIAETSASEVAEILEGMSDAFFAIDANWIVTRINRQYENVVKMKRKDVVGKSLIELYFTTPEQKESLYVKTYTQVMKTREKASFIDYYEPLNLWTALQVYPKPDGGIAVFFREISKEKRAEQELQEAIKSRDEFLSIASHELKTPLTSLKLQSQMLKRLLAKNDQALTKEHISRFLKQTEKQISRLTRLIDDMLDISRIRTGKLNISKQSIDLCELVMDTVNRFSDQFLSKEYDLPAIECCKRAMGDWDSMRIEQALDNILTNAIRYGNGNPISIRVESTGDVARIAVKDNGLGISKEDQERIFQRFQRVSDLTDTSGLGLGLYLTQQIVNAHGGRIWVESEIGKGSTFFIELPKSFSSSEGVNVKD